MCEPLYTQKPNDDYSDCPLRHTLDDQWLQDLPLALKDMVVTPVSFDVARDYEMRADRTYGHDAAHQPCFNEFRFVLTELCCDDDDEFYEAPVYAEALTSWRLVDERWLVCKTIVDGADAAQTQTRFFLSNTMPR